MLDSNTRVELEKSFLEVSRGAARNKLYALRAEQDANPQLARLFRAMARSQEAQALRFLLQLRGQIGGNKQNCSISFTEELPALVEHFQQAQRIATIAKERTLEGVFSHSAKVNRICLNLKKNLDQNPGKEIPYQVCSFCGFIMEGSAPDTCPICTAPKGRFQKV